MNPLYQQMMPQNNLAQKFAQFKANFNGDPRQRIQQMLNSGQITQSQYDQAVQTANQLRQLMNM